MIPSRAEYEPAARRTELTLEGPRPAPLVSRSSLVMFGWLSALLLLFVAAPVVGHVASIRLVEAAVCGVALVCAIRRTRDAATSRLTIMLTAFAALTVVSAIVGLAGQRHNPSPYPNPLFGGGAGGPLQILADQIAALAAFSLLSTSQFPTDSSKRDGFRFAIEATAACIASLCAVVLLHDHSPGTRIEVGFGNPNLLASFLVMCFPVVAAGLFSKSERPAVSRQIMRAAVALVILVALWFTGSRGALLGVCVSGAVLAFAWRLRRGNRLGAGAVVWSFVAVALLAGVVAVRHSAAVGGISHDRSDQQRRVVWHAATLIAASHPLTGVGLGGFPSAMRSLHLREPNPATPSGLPMTPAVHLHAHNILLQYAAERGVPGLGAIVVLLAGLLVTGLSLNRMRTGNVFQIAAAAGLCGLLLQNVFDYTLWYAPLLILAWCLASVVITSQKISDETAQNLVFRALQ